MSKQAQLDLVIQAAIAYNNYDTQQKEFARITKGLHDPRAKEIYSKLEKRLNSAIIQYVEELQF